MRASIREALGHRDLIERMLRAIDVSLGRLPAATEAEQLLLGLVEPETPLDHLKRGNLRWLIRDYRGALGDYLVVMSDPASRARVEPGLLLKMSRSASMASVEASKEEEAEFRQRALLWIHEALVPRLGRLLTESLPTSKRAHERRELRTYLKSLHDDMDFFPLRDDPGFETLLDQAAEGALYGKRDVLGRAHAAYEAEDYEIAVGRFRVVLEDPEIRASLEENNLYRGAAAASRAAAEARSPDRREAFVNQALEWLRADVEWRRARMEEETSSEQSRRLGRELQLYLQAAETDPDFDALRDLPDFKSLVGADE